ncbi:protein serine/threonine phosphatase 2C [Trametes meyenii]|nr:protein serine/threonine phosphatase 2C [Trametes meyenii]
MTRNPQRLDATRQKLLESFHGLRSSERDVAVHTVTFQPSNRYANQDRFVVRRWDILGQRWLLLVLCDGHGGYATSQYTVDRLPLAIAAALGKLIIQRFGGLLDRVNYKEAAPLVEDMLKREIVAFDNSIGKAVEGICPEPRDLDEAAAQKLIRVRRFRNIVQRAAAGTSLSLALVAVDDRLMWAAGVGDSTIALSTVDETGKRGRAEQLCALHALHNLQEHARVIVAHPVDTEIDSEDEDEPLRPVFGGHTPSRAIGDFHLKMDGSYLRHLFRFVSVSGGPPFTELADKILVPPYLNAEPSVRFIDLKPAWGKEPVLLLYSGGVDNIVDGSNVFTPGQHSGVDPLEFIPRLMSSKVEPYIEEVLGHSMEPRWSRSLNNVAVDILGNLLGGTNVDRLDLFTDWRHTRTIHPHLRIRDTTLTMANLPLE